MFGNIIKEGKSTDAQVCISNDFCKSMLSVVGLCELLKSIIFSNGFDTTRHDVTCGQVLFGGLLLHCSIT